MENEWLPKQKCTVTNRNRAMFPVISYKQNKTCQRQTTWRICLLARVECFRRLITGEQESDQLSPLMTAVQAEVVLRFPSHERLCVCWAVQHFVKEACLACGKEQTQGYRLKIEHNVLTYQAVNCSFYPQLSSLKVCCIQIC